MTTGALAMSEGIVEEVRVGSACGQAFNAGASCDVVEIELEFYLELH